MDPVAGLFIVLMVALGGISAYVADVMGYKIGKKRLTVWHIRPRHVARIAVVTAGMLIPLVTILVLYAASADFRDWVTKGREEVLKLEKKIKSGNERQVELEKRGAELDNKNRIQNADIEKKKADIAKQEKILKGLQVTMSELSGKLATSQAKVTSAQAKASQLQVLNASTKAKYDKTQAAFVKASSALDLVNKNLRETEDSYKAVRANYNETSQRNLKLTNDNAELQKNNENLQKSLDDLQKKISNLNKDIESLNAEKVQAVSDAKNATGELAEIQAELEKLNSKLAEFKASADYQIGFARVNPISFLKGEELARAPISNGLNRAAATTIYRNVLRKVKAVASEIGAQPNSTYPFTGSAGAILTEKSGRTLTESEVEDFWIQQMMQPGPDRIMVVRASTNRFATEPVTLEFNFYPNPIVFHKGDIVAESKVDGRASTSEIRATVREFLKTYVNTKARSRKMVPRITRDGESYGNFTEDQFFDFIDRVKSVTRVARLVAIVQDDIRAGDPLAIELDVR